MSSNVVRQHLATGGHAAVFGIAEFECWYTTWDDPDIQFPMQNPRQAITDCLDAHLAAGISNVVWECGRSLVSYRSGLEHASWGSPGGGRMPPLGELCPLREALAYGHAHGMSVSGRLCMNRHYGTSTPEKRSAFVRAHPEWLERGRLGGGIPHRLCYAIPEVQQERIDILLEVQRIGVDAIVPDFCRQMPVLGYHDALVVPFREQTGQDPRTWRSTDPEDYAAWFRYRADVLTGFMRKLRAGIRQQADALGRECPVIARVPDAAPWLMLAYGLDTETWLREGLIDGVMLSPFPRTIEDLRSYPAYHAKLAHDHGAFCIGGIGALNLYRPKGQGGSRANTGFYDPQPAYARQHSQYAAGCDGTSLYQSEILARLDYLQAFVRDMGDHASVAGKATSLPVPDKGLLTRHASSAASIGLDWHAAWCPPVFRKGESLSPAISESKDGWRVAL